MIYVALLRGINVGGNNKVEMKKLKQTFEQVGLKNVKTYINSGNILFEDTAHKPNQLTELLEHAIEKDFGFAIKVLLRSLDQIKAVNQALPKHWANNTDTKCDVMFLWENIDHLKILDQFPINNEIEDLKYIPGTVFWRVDRQHATKSKVIKIIGTKLYKEMTIRNCNTVRKLLELMTELKT